MSDVASQLPPADELHAVRSQMKALEEREAALRSLLLSDPSTRTGNHYAVEVRVVTQDRTDLKELKACHPSLVEEFTFPQEIKRLVLLEISEDGEVTSIRSRREKSHG